MKTKKQFKSGIRISKRIAGNVNIELIQKITGKYGTGNLKSQFAKLILRQYKRALAGNNLKADTENNTIIRNHNNYFNYNNTNKYVLNYLTQTTNQKNIKNNEEMPAPFNILRVTQLNSYNNLQSNIFHNYSQTNLLYSLQKHQDVIMNSSGNIVLSQVAIADRPAVINIFKHLSEKYTKNLTEKVLKNISLNASLYISKGRKKDEQDRREAERELGYSEPANKTALRASDTAGLLFRSQNIKKIAESVQNLNADQLKSESKQDSFTGFQRKKKLSQDRSIGFNSEELIPKFTKTVIEEQQLVQNMLFGRIRNVVKNIISERNQTLKPQEAGQSEAGQVQRFAEKLSKTFIKTNYTTRLLLKSQNIKNTGISEISEGLPGSTKQQPLQNRLADNIEYKATRHEITGKSQMYASEKLKREDQEAKQEQRYSKAPGKMSLRVYNSMRLLLKTGNIKKHIDILETEVELKNKKQLSLFVNSHRQEELIHGEIAEHELKELNPLKPLNPIVVKAAASEHPPLQNRISDKINSITARNALTNISPGIPTEKSGGAGTVKPYQDSIKVLNDNTNAQMEKVENSEKEIPSQSEMVFRTSTTKTAAKKDFTPTNHSFIKSALVHADGAISKIIGSFSKKQNEGKGFLRENIYKNSTELIPAGVKKSGQLKAEEQQKKKYFNENDNNSLTLFKPNKQDTASESEKDKTAINGNSEVFANTVSSSKSKKISINDIEAEEVNLLADKILKILERRISIQKDRRGLR